MGTAEGCSPALPWDPTTAIGVLIVKIFIKESVVFMALMEVFAEAIRAEVGGVSDFASLAIVEVYVRLIVPS